MKRKSKKNNNKLIKGIIIGIVIIIVILIIWGLIGGNEASGIGTTCDLGLGKTFCWSWHKNDIGKLGEAIGGIIG